MELDKIENLLEKYFEGETSLPEEKQLRAYFTSDEVEPHLQQYRVIFGYFKDAQQEELKEKLVKKRNANTWLSLAASVVVMFGVGTYAYLNEQQDLGTYNDPEKAFLETQKALMLLSKNVNKGVNSVEYVGEYEESKDRIFKN
jgi:7-cyano-7-deazaguanine synthase in queuosine biosynthesis